MTVFTYDAIRQAMRAAETTEMPLPEAEETLRLLSSAAAPALAELPPHHDCDVVREALMTMFLMGIVVGVELERG